MKTGSVLLCFIVFGSLFAVPSASDDVDRITTLQLREWLDSPDTVILDVRAEEDWRQSEFKIRGAFRAAPSKFDEWADRYDKDATLVLY